MPQRTQVVVAGAGPVGATAAFMLAREGLDVILLEAADHCQEDLRASTFHASTLEMLSTLGVTDDMHAVGLVAPIYQYRDRQSHERFSFDLTELSDMTSFPYRLQCEQWKLSRIMIQRLDAFSHAQVLFGHRVKGCEQSANGVTVETETGGATETFEADYLIGADGANSVVRKGLDVSFEGFTYPEKFVTFSTQYPIENHFEDLALVNYIVDPEEWLVALRVRDLWRVQIAAPLDCDDDVVTSDENKNALFRRLVGSGVEVDTVHRTVYRVHQRVANRYVHGRIVLVGDAAHLNNPLGGLGMNSGIHDIWNLCPKLVAIINGQEKPEPLLGLFDRQRRTTMSRFIQQQTKLNKRNMEAADDKTRAKFRDEMRTIHADPVRRRDYLLSQSMFNSLKDEAKIS